MEITQKFVKDVTEFSCKIAKHRKSDLLETKDLVLGLSKYIYYNNVYIYNSIFISIYLKYFLNINLFIFCIF